MVDKKKFEKQIPNNLVVLESAKCCSEGCKKKIDKAEFCSEHFEWFKAGLITREGVKASDFEKKYYHYISAKKVA